MDLISHAIAGAATGAYFGAPVTGAVIAMAPDVVLGIRRRDTPTRAYKATHSALAVAIGTLACILLGLHPALAFWCLVSHLILDMPTHGEEWAPPLLYPWSERKLVLGGEWEFFNIWWASGLLLTATWTLIWQWLTYNQS